MSLSSAVTISNIAFFALSTLAVIASVGVFVLTNKNERANDRQLEQHNAAAAAHIAEAHARAQEARTEAEQARAAAALARQKTLELEAELLNTQAKLNKSDAVEQLPAERLEAVKAGLRGLPLGDAVLIITAVDDRQAQFWALEIDRAISAAGVSRPYGSGFDLAVNDPSDHGDIEISYCTKPYETLATRLKGIFHGAGFKTSVRMAPADAQPSIRELEKNWIRITVLKPKRPRY